MIRIVSWNIARRRAPWETLLAMDADVALLQEARRPRVELPPRVEIDPSPWHMASPGHTPWKAAVVKLSNRVQVGWIKGESIPEGEWDGLGISRPGTLAAATVTPPDSPPFVVASMYGVLGEHASFNRKRLDLRGRVRASPHFGSVETDRPSDQPSNRRCRGPQRPIRLRRGWRRLRGRTLRDGVRPDGEPRVAFRWAATSKWGPGRSMAKRVAPRQPERADPP